MNKRVSVLLVLLAATSTGVALSYEDTGLFELQKPSADEVQGADAELGPPRDTAVEWISTHAPERLPELTTKSRREVVRSVAAVQARRDTHRRAGRVR